MAQEVNVAKMLAVIKRERKRGAEIDEVERPSPGPGEVLIRVLRTSICGTDKHIYNWDRWAEGRIKPPLVVGHEFCGIVEQLGAGTRWLKEGDFVSGETHIPCGFCYQCRTGNQHICKDVLILGVDTNGCFAEYVKIPEICCWRLPKDFDPELASIMEPFGNAVYCVMESDVSLKTLLLVGDGPVAVFSAGIAKAVGAGMILCVGRHDDKLELVGKMGAHHTFNEKKGDPIAWIKDLTHGELVDVTLDLAGSPKAIETGFECLKRAGTYVAFGVSQDDMVNISINRWIIFKGAKVLGINGRKMFETWYQSQTLIERGLVDPRPAITHRFPLKDFLLAMETAVSREQFSVKVLLEASAD